MNLHRPLKISTLAWGLIFLAAAVLYYGLYWRAGFLISDEGSAALLSQRLMGGERPFRDLALGYNVLWFYPITAIFSIVGPNLLAMRVWFFGVATISAIVVFFAARRFSGKDLPAVLAAALVLLLPGSTYKTVIPFAVVLNGACLLWLAVRVAEGRTVRAPLLYGALALGLTTLARADIGYPMALVWIVALALARIAAKQGLAPGAIRWARDVAVVLTLALALHLPFVALARAQGWGAEWATYYRVVLGMYTQPVAAALDEDKEPPPKRAKEQRKTGAEKPGTESVEASPKQKEKAETTGWPRVPLSTIWSTDKKLKIQTRIWAILAYAPVLTCGLLMFAGAGLALTARRKPAALGAGIAAAAAASLCAYPQFLFYRPDTAHLSEFMPGLLLAMAAAAGVAAQSTVGKRGGAALVSIGVMVVLAAHAGLWGWYGIRSTSAGGFLQRALGEERFVGKNGVDVFVPAQQATYLRAVAEFVEAHSTPGDFMVCYPYWPGLNFMCDRPTYEENLYVDNITSGSKWQQKTLEKFREHQPRIVITHDWEVNATEASRFSNWAPEVVQHLESEFPVKAESEGFKMYGAGSGQ